MAQNFLECRREQAYLMAPSLRDWLAEDHLAWFVVQTVERLYPAGVFAAYREDGHGRAAYEPSMVVTLLMYAYATEQRSSRAIEGHCRQDVAYRVITGNLVPDHATVARFVVRHEAALADLFGEVLRLRDGAGLRMSCMAMRVAMSCPSSCARRRVDASSLPSTSARARKLTPQSRLQMRRHPTLGLSSMPSGSSAAFRVGRGGCATPSASSSSAAGKTRIRSHARAPSGWGSRASGWRKISMPSAVGTRRMRSIGPVGG